MVEPVTAQFYDGVAVLVIDNPPVNALSATVRAKLKGLVEDLSENPRIKALVISCAGKTFVAGADISEFGKPLKGPALSEVWHAIEECKKPVVAAIHGTALGGGFELALACHYRCAVPTAKVGLPEVKLGLLPGGGGTQRLPRLIGVSGALELILSGRNLSMDEALSLGVVDRLIEGDLLKGAIEFGLQAASRTTFHRKLSQVVIDGKSVTEGFFEAQRAQVAEKFPALLCKARIIDCVEGAVTLDFQEGLARERELFLECRGSAQSAALRHLFFATREVGKIPGIGREIPARAINLAGVVGAGRMGTGIAVCLSNAGIDVKLLDSDPASLKRGMGEIKRIYDSQVKRGRQTREEAGRCLSRITPVSAWKDFESADLVIEAAFEDRLVKKEIFTALDQVLKPGAILATNTSSINLDQLAEFTRRPEEVIGLHFFNPANVMALLEIVRGQATSKEVIKTAFALAARMGKTGVLSGVTFGFIGNRMLARYTSECNLMMLMGVEPERLDRVMTSFGMAMGPNRVADLIGLDVRLNVLTEAEKNGLAEISRWPRAVAEALSLRGRLGQKTNAGFYLYPAPSGGAVCDPAVVGILREVALTIGVSKREISDEEIVDRCLCQLAAEGARLLSSGIALRAGDIDVVWTKGYGFPDWRGGPMHWAKTKGSAWLKAKINKYSKESPVDQWGDCDGLEKYWEEGS